MGRGENLISRFSTLYYVTHPVLNRSYWICKETRKYVPFTETKQKWLTETIPEEITKQRL